MFCFELCICYSFLWRSWWRIFACHLFLSRRTRPGLLWAQLAVLTRWFFQSSQMTIGVSGLFRALTARSVVRYEERERDDSSPLLAPKYSYAISLDFCSDPIPQATWDFQIIPPQVALILEKKTSPPFFISKNKYNEEVTSGEITKACVFKFPSFLFVKFLLYEVTMKFLVPGGTSCLSHWPIQRPQTLAKTVPHTYKAHQKFAIFCMMSGSKTKNNQKVTYHQLFWKLRQFHLFQLWHELVQIQE